MLCTVCGRENAEDSRFCNGCGNDLVHADAPERRKLVTVLFCDLAESTALGERLDPETLKRILFDYFHVARTAVERHGGVVEKFIGDAVMAVFGMPSVHEDDAYRAVRAAWEIRGAIEKLNDRLEPRYGVRLSARIGVNTGEVVTAHAGTLALGDAVNVASRLEQLAEPGEVMLGELTAKLVRSRVELEPLEPSTLKGKTAPITVHRLLMVRDLPGLESSGPLIGREDELAAVHDAFERAGTSGEAHLLTLLGPPGIGKTRLAAELATNLGASATVLVGRCLSYGTGLAYWPVAEMLEYEPGVDLRGRLDSLLQGVDEAKEIASRVAAAVGGADIAGTTDETTWAVRRLLEALARDRPLVCVFEDFQWAQPALVELVLDVVDHSRNSAMLCVCIARPELLDLQPSWAEWHGATILRLGPLPDVAAHELLGRFADPRLSEEVRIRALKAAEGNPLFLQQLLAAAAESDGESEPLPVVLMALLEARLDRLPWNERKLLQTAAIEGNVFHTRALAALLDVAEGDVHGSLLSLIRRELVRPARASIPGADAYRFEHGLVREAAYAALPKLERSGLHERFAAWIDVDLGPGTPEADALIGHHLDMSVRCRTELGLIGDETDRVAVLAAERLASAGRRSLRSGDVHAAHAQLLRASNLLAERSPARIDLLPDLAVAEFQVTGIREALETADSCIQLAQGPEFESPRMHATVLRSFWTMFANPENVDLDALRATLEEAVRTFERRDEPLGVVRARNLLWEIWQWRGETEQQTSAAITALEAADRVASAEDTDWAICNLGFALLDGPDPLPFATQKLQEWHDRMQDRAGRIMLGAFLDYASALAGDTATAVRGIDRADLVGTAYVTEVPRLMWGRVALAARDYPAAERQFRAGWEAARAADDNWFGPLAASELARALLEQRRIGEAKDVDRMARPGARRT